MTHNIIIRAPNWIGDCIMALPALRALKDRFPGVKFCLVTRQYLAGVFENIEEISEMITIPDTVTLKTIFKAAKKIKNHGPGFDAGILFTNSFRSALLFKLAGIKKCTGYSRDFRGPLLHEKIKFPRDRRHHIHFYLDLAAAFRQGETGPGRAIRRDCSNRLVITAEERENTASVLSALGIDIAGKTVIGMSPSAAYGSAKAWLPARFAALIKRIPRENTAAIPDPAVLLFGSPKEREMISQIVAGAAAAGNVYNLAGRLSLRQTITAISFCRAFASNDSGLMHIASSLDIPLVALFGPTQPHKTGPLNEKTKIIHHAQALPCAPCLHRECPLDHPCMTAITVDEVYEALVSLLSSPAPGASTTSTASTASDSAGAAAPAKNE